MASSKRLFKTDFSNPAAIRLSHIASEQLMDAAMGVQSLKQRNAAPVYGEHAKIAMSKYRIGRAASYFPENG
jgi:hypothetical protein